MLEFMESEGAGFSWALCHLKEGRMVSRKGWKGKGMYLKVQFPDENSANTEPYIFIVPSKDERLPWVASQKDLFAQDWIPVIDREEESDKSPDEKSDDVKIEEDRKEKALGEKPEVNRLSQAPKKKLSLGPAHGRD